MNTEKFTINIGNEVTITDAGGNTSTVVLTDVQATNGVIHVIEQSDYPSTIYKNLIFCKYNTDFVMPSHCIVMRRLFL